MDMVAWCWSELRNPVENFSGWKTQSFMLKNQRSFNVWPIFACDNIATIVMNSL